eukprot:TRINITY_DN12741_c0_g1_i1.p1 TRINITY_DN12741_c0_g1~~TRINITY_DN12741_c0_g1_i1.p1  ORF type:complete len:910 (+),score=198.47 TRINITY_DN12741_c0_g1_i1:113-2842(+)
MTYGVGDIVDKYEVLRFLGRGACGEVFLVRRGGEVPLVRRGPKEVAAAKRGGNLFAMKVIPCDCPSRGEDDEVAAERAREKAVAEARLLQEIRHPHVVHCEEVSFDPTREATRLVLEYMDGGDLQGLVEDKREKGGCFEAHFARRFLAAVGGALVYIHGSGILHRDVKPANVLLSRRSCRIKLADFGIAKLVEATTLVAKTLVGTPHYFSPEIVSGEEYGPPSDAWALGVCLYEIVALKRPFEASNQLALVRKVCDESPAPLQEGVAADVFEVIWGLLEKKPVRRMRLDRALAVSPAVAALVVQPSRSSSSAAGDGLDADAELAHSASEVDSDSVGECDGTRSGSEGEEEEDGRRAAGGSGGDDDSEGDTDSWSGASRLPSWPLGGGIGSAAGAARAALGAYEDDPEDLRYALSQLERERNRSVDGGNDDRVELTILAPPSDDCGATLACVGGTAATRMARDEVNDVDDVNAAVLDSLGEELRLRLSAMREEAAALLDGIFEADDPMDGADATLRCSDETLAFPAAASKEATLQQPACTIAAERSTCESGGGDEGAGSSGSGSCVSTPRGSLCPEEEAIEVATCLGVDTEPAELRLASVRRMLSIRVVWGYQVKFFLLPLRLSLDALVRQVSARFGVPLHDAGAVLECWSGVGDTLPLSSQANWEECLQRRGLAERPGRLELRIVGVEPPPRRRPAAAPMSRPRRQLRRRQQGGEDGDGGDGPTADSVDAGAGGEDASMCDFLVTGMHMQALRGGAHDTSVASAPSPQPRGKIPARRTATASSAGREPARGSSAGKGRISSTGRQRGPNTSGSNAVTPAGSATPARGGTSSRRSRGAGGGGGSHLAGAASTQGGGVAWGKTTGREQRVHWAPERGGATSTKQRSEDAADGGADLSLLGLSLEGRSAARR